MVEIKEVQDIETAERVAKFLTSDKAFDPPWYPNERNMVSKAPYDSLNNSKHKYFYAEENGEVIGAIGVRENKYATNGYEMDYDYFAVHKDHRRKGIASQLLQRMEEFVRMKKGRYVHILSSDTDSFKPAIDFYQDNGYERVAFIPNYYSAGDSRIDFLKALI